MSDVEKLIDEVLKQGGVLRLNRGKVRLSADKPLAESLISELREHKADVVAYLSGGAAALAENPSPPREWVEGVKRVAGMDCPNNWPEHKWPKTQTSITAFLDKWGATATALGWGTLDVFGAHRHAPYHRLASAGLALSCRANDVAVMLHDRATIVTPSGARLNYYRRKRHCSDTVPVWDMGANHGP